MSTPIIHIDLDALDARLQGGELWTDGWGNPADPDQSTCLHGAIRYCQPIKGDACLIEQVGARYGFGTSDNDAADSWAVIRAKVVPDITDEMLADTFGPQWEQIVALVRRAATLTADEAQRLADARFAAQDAAQDAARFAAWAAARDAARFAAWAAARDAARDAARFAAWAAARVAARVAAQDAAWVAVWDAARVAARDAAWAAARAAWDAAMAVVVRDLIGQHGFTQAHYDLLTGPWRQVIEAVHPDDAEVTA